FRWTGGDSENGYTHVGSVRGFTTSDAGDATFTLHLADAAGCDYDVSAHVEDGHLKGSYSGCAGATGRNRGSFDLTPSGNGAQTATIVSAPAPCTVTVRVKSTSGHPIEDAQLLLDDVGMSSQSVRTDASGMAAFSAQPGTYELSVAADGYNALETPDFVLLGEGCSKTLNATLAKASPTRKPRTPTKAETKAAVNSNALILAMSNAEKHYCKTAAQMACSYYMMHAGSCLSTALGAYPIYETVVTLKKAGLSSAQVVDIEARGHGGSMSDAALIAAAAARIIDDHEHYDPDVFEMAVLRACLAGVPR
ncbi:MAG: carboxypeptidase-like regulatory domain-containing protein, partial [Candidatus Aquilonibacter sp.]